MRTARPFSTISYNSESYLKSRLDELVNRRVLDFYAFIEHIAEEDEEKNHFHLYMEPSSIIQTDTITDYLKEDDEKHPDKPLGCIHCKSSKFGDWYMYACHDKAYLMSKGQTRKHHYVQEQFVVSDMLYFREEIHCIDRSKYVGMERIREAVEDGVDFRYMVKMGQIPVQLIKQYEYAYECMSSNSTYRAGRETHTPKVPAGKADKVYLFDEETGEVIFSVDKLTNAEMVEKAEMKGKARAMKNENVSVDDLVGG